MSVRSAWLLPLGQTREDTRLSPVGTFAPESEIQTRDGVIAGGKPFAATGAGAMSLQIGIGRALVQGTTMQGAYPVTVDAPETVTFGDGDAQFTRIDAVVLHVYDQLFDEYGQNLAQVEIVTGTPAATPAASSLPPACLRLWDVTIPAGASAGVGGIDWSSALADRRRYTAAYGGIIPRGLTSDVGGYDGQYADIGGTLYRWSEPLGTWQVYRAPDLPTETATSGLTVASGWSNPVFRARRRNGVITVRVQATRTGGQLTGDSQGNFDDVLVATLPPDWLPAFDMETSYNRNNVTFGSASVQANGSMFLRSTVPGGNVLNGQPVSLSATYVA
ncbi:hypothetical protein ACWEQC_00460 [Streptomyces shenzhenensis]